MFSCIGLALLLAWRGRFGSTGEFDHRDRRGVAAPHAIFDYSRVAARPLLEARCNLVEKLFYRAVRSQERKGAAMRRQDRKSTRLNFQSRRDLVCRLLLEK